MSASTKTNFRMTNGRFEAEKMHAYLLGKVVACEEAARAARDEAGKFFSNSLDKDAAAWRNFATFLEGRALKLRSEVDTHQHESVDTELPVEELTR